MTKIPIAYDQDDSSSGHYSVFGAAQAQEDSSYHRFIPSFTTVFSEEISSQSLDRLVSKFYPSQDNSKDEGKPDNSSLDHLALKSFNSNSEAVADVPGNQAKKEATVSRKTKRKRKNPTLQTEISEEKEDSSPTNEKMGMKSLQRDSKMDLHLDELLDLKDEIAQNNSSHGWSVTRYTLKISLSVPPSLYHGIISLVHSDGLLSLDGTTR